MSIEIKIKNGTEIILNPIKKNMNDSENIYELLDNLNKVWMEIELNNGTFKVLKQNSKIDEDKNDLITKLDLLALDVIEAEQSGTENNETSPSEEINPYDPNKIKVHSKQFSLKLIEEMIDNGDIDFKPDFQRNFVWNSIQKSRLIESILLRIPLPVFYFSEDEEGKISIVDGLQRLTTIKDFIDNKFSLKNLEYLKDSCEGKFYSSKDKEGNDNGKQSIDAKYFRWFNMTQFSVNVIDPSSPSKVKYDIFRRINTGGKPLNNQEIRNCLAGSGLRDTLRKMVNLPEFKTATDYSIKSTRMNDQEVALRFILFYRLNNENKALEFYNGYMDSSLDDITEEFAKKTKEQLEHYVDLFSNTMKNAEYLFGYRYAFRKVTPSDLNYSAKKQLINKALFVSCSVLLADYEFKKIKALNSKETLLKPLANMINDNSDFMNYLSYGTNSRANILYVFKKIKEIINKNLKY